MLDRFGSRSRIHQVASTNQITDENHVLAFEFHILTAPPGAMTSIMNWAEAPNVTTLTAYIYSLQGYFTGHC